MNKQQWKPVTWFNKETGIEVTTGIPSFFRCRYCKQVVTANTTWSCFKSKCLILLKLEGLQSWYDMVTTSFLTS